MARDRAKRGGLSVKLGEFLDRAKRSYKRKEPGFRMDTPRNGAQLAKWLTSKGESAGESTIRGWLDGETLPEARFVPLIERLMGVPFSYLDDPDTTWPPSPDDQQIIRAFHAPKGLRSKVAAAIRAVMDEGLGESPPPRG